MHMAASGVLMSKDDSAQTIQITVINTSLEETGVAFHAQYKFDVGREFNIKYAFSNREHAYPVKITWQREKDTGNYHGCKKIA